MVDMILCLVALILLVWVVLLKLEIEELKGPQAQPNVSSKGSAVSNGAVSGMKKFSIG